MKKGLTDITVVLDRSGSMESTRTDAIGGFNAFVQSQKEVKGEATLTLVQFDDHYNVDYSGQYIKTVANLTMETFQPRGSTALHDAIGRTINTVGARLAATVESKRPEKVVILVITDGGENASREFDAVKVAEMIKHQQDKYSWEFVFVGANQDAVLTAKNLGINMNNAMTYANNGMGTTRAYASLAANMTAYRTGSASGMSFSSADKDAQVDAGLTK
jgi:uncharacterized protein YegL